MFCPNCGKQVPDGIKFCPQCGKSISSSESSDLPKQSTIEVAPRTQIKIPKVVVGIVFVLAVATATIFIVRANNEKNMISQVPWMIYDDETKEDVNAYYKDYLGESFMTGCDAEDFSIKQGTDSNTFNLTGKITVTDTSQTDRPTYNVNVIGTVTTNFLGQTIL